MKLAIPVTVNRDGETVYEKCVYNKRNYSDVVNGPVQKEECSAWVYDKSIYDSTFTSEVTLNSLFKIIIFIIIFIRRQKFIF